MYTYQLDLKRIIVYDVDAVYDTNTDVNVNADADADVDADTDANA